MHGRRERGLRRPPVGGDQRRDPGGRQRRELEPRDRLIARELVQRGVVGEIAERPRGQHDRDRQALQAQRQVQQELHGRLVGPLRVVDDERQRAEPLGEVDHEPVQPLAARERDVVRRRRSAALTGLEDRPRVPSRSLPTPVVLAQDAREELLRDPERLRLLELGPARAQHAQARAGHALARGVEHGRLAHPGLAEDERHPAVAAQSRARQRVQPLQLVVALVGGGLHRLGATLSAHPVQVKGKEQGGVPSRCMTRGSRIAACSPSEPS